LVLLALYFVSSKIEFHFDPPYLYFILNFIFIFCISIIIVVLSSKSFFKSKTIHTLLKSCAFFIYGLGTLAAGRYVIQEDINLGVTVANLTFFLASVLFLFSSVIILKNKEPIKVSPRINLLILTLSYLLSIAIIAAIILLTISNIIPKFFIQGTGSTVIREIIILLSILILIIVLSLNFYIFNISSNVFYFYFSLGLSLIVITYSSSLFTATTGGLLSWFTRIIQYIGSILFLIAVISLSKEAPKKGLGFFEAFSQMPTQTGNENIENMINIAPIGVAIYNTEGKLVFINNYYKKYFNLNFPISLDESFKNLKIRKIEGSLNKTIENPIKRALSGEVIRDEEILLKQDKQYLYFSIYATPFKSETGKISNAIIFINDITDQKKAEKNKLKTFQEKILILERKRIARELHDTVSQSLFASNLMSESISKSWNKKPEAVLKNLEIIRGLNTAALSDIRILLTNLMPEKISKINLIELIKTLLNSFKKRLEIKTDFIYDGNYNFTNKVKLEVYYIAQEIFNNILKHSEATYVNVRLKLYYNNLEMIISDNGKGFNLKDKNTRRRFGINIMRERTKLINASLNITSNPGQGTTVLLSKKS
jgi:signal transduction histidine kinase